MAKDLYAKTVTVEIDTIILSRQQDDKQKIQRKELFILGNLYFQAACFPTEEKAGKVYFPLQKLVYETREECNLSVFRFKITEGWHVVVLGEQPPDALHVQVEALLT